MAGMTLPKMVINKAGLDAGEIKNRSNDAS